MRVIGVDPGYDRVGIAVMELRDGREHLIESCCLTTDRAAAAPERLQQLGDAFRSLLQTHTPDGVAIETLFFNKNQTTAMGVAQARGALIYLAASRGCAVYEFGPQEVKVAVTGYGKSDKGAVIDMVRRLVPAAPARALDDEYDAIAIGITCLAHHGRGG